MELSEATGQAFTMAAELLPPGMGVCLAAAVAKSMFRPEHEAEYAERFWKTMQKKVDCSEISIDQKLAHRLEQAGLPTPRRLFVYEDDGEPQAFHSYGNVGISRSLWSEDDVPAHFALGHELSHYKHRDEVGWLGVEQLRTLLEPYPATTVQITEQERVLSHFIEHRADREGVHVPDLGFDPEIGLMRLMGAFLGGEWAASRSHPDTVDRWDVLRSELKQE